MNMVTAQTGPLAQTLCIICQISWFDRALAPDDAINEGHHYYFETVYRRSPMKLRRAATKKLTTSQINLHFNQVLIFVEQLNLNFVIQVLVGTVSSQTEVLYGSIIGTLQPNHIAEEFFEQYY